MTDQNRRVDIVEVSPRDGLQDELVVVPVDARIELVERAIGSGLRRIEAASFVRSDLVPTMADAEAVMEGISRVPGLRLSGLVLNERGLDRALSVSVDEVNVVVVVTESFSRRNQGMGVDEALDMWARVARAAHSSGIGASITMAAAFGCPYEGVVDQSRVRELVKRASDAGPFEIALADTIGCAVPTEVTALVRGVRMDTDLPVRVHLHNSRNTGYANAVAAVDAGATSLDTSIGGIGGCPFAPGATGNVATEDIAYLMERMGIATGIRLDAILDTSGWLAGVLGHSLPGQLVKSGVFPPPSHQPSSHSTN